MKTRLGEVCKSLWISFSTTSSTLNLAFQVWMKYHGRTVIVLWLRIGGFVRGRPTGSALFCNRCSRAQAATMAQINHLEDRFPLFKLLLDLSCHMVQRSDWKSHTDSLVFIREVMCWVLKPFQRSSWVPSSMLLRMNFYKRQMWSPISGPQFQWKSCIGLPDQNTLGILWTKYCSLQVPRYGEAMFCQFVNSNS